MKTDTSQGFAIKMLSYEDLIIAKNAAARLQDLLDISKLEEE